MEPACKKKKRKENKKQLSLTLNSLKLSFSCAVLQPSEEFELTANSLGAHMKVTESSPTMGHGELILRTFI